MNIGIVVGETSGNNLGAGLMQALLTQQPALQFSGIGGPDMIAAGFDSLYDMERLAVMGLVEPLRRLPELFRIRRGLYQHFSQQKPQVFIGIDAPDFNLGLELQLRQQGIPIVHYVSPSVWAWRQNRIKKIAKATDLVLTLLPFEKAFYDKHGVPAHFVGHPLADKIPLQIDKALARQTLGLALDDKIIALLPGSRRNEIHFLGEAFITAAQRCWQEKRTLKFITSAANALRDQEMRALCQRIAPDLPIQFYQGQTHAAMAAADVILVGSGTATLEAMLHKRPMVIAYRMANLTYRIAKHLVKIPRIGLPNLLADAPLVPEFIQDAVTPENLSQALLAYLDDAEGVARLEKQFLTIHQTLQRNANQEAASAVLTLLKSKL